MEIVLLIVAVVCAFLGYIIVENPEKKAMGGILGLLLGPIGILIAVLLK